MAAGVESQDLRPRHKQCCPLCDEFEDLSREEQIEAIFEGIDAVHGHALNMARMKPGFWREEQLGQIFDRLSVLRHYQYTFRRVHGPDMVAF
jgi:hypothetical protein